MTNARIYLDHNATAPPRPQVRTAMLAALDIYWGNPSSGHTEGRAARALVKNARASVAALVGARPAEVIFVSGATEALHLALASAPVGRVLISGAEHPAVRSALKALGRPFETLALRTDGVLDLPAALQAIDAGPKVGLVVCLAASGETGVFQPCVELLSALAARTIASLMDATQYIGWAPLPSPRATWTVLSSHKIGGPKGAGALVLGSSASESAPALRPQITGSQERGLRGGTEAVPVLAGFGAAAQTTLEGRQVLGDRLQILRDDLAERLIAITAGLTIVGVGTGTKRLPNTLTLLLPQGIEAEPLVTTLDRAGFAVSAGSACRTGSLIPSPSLLALGLSPLECFRVLRISMGPTTTAAQLDAFADAWPIAIAQVG